MLEISAYRYQQILIEESHAFYLGMHAVIIVVVLLLELQVSI